MNILLCCAAGMSTSLLVTKMEKSAQEQSTDYKIWAVPGDSVRNHIDQADVLLLGEEKGVPVDVINPVHYGTCNGEQVLKFAVQLVSK